MIKRYVKAAVIKHPRYNAEQIISKVKEFQYISFDVFDTLIKRSTVSPEGVFARIGKKQDVSTFLHDRMKAEKYARRKAEEQGKQEIRIIDIYRCMPTPYSTEIEKWIALELAEEIAVCYCNQVMKEVYDYCLAEGKTIIITSDMYISREFLTHLLDKCGYHTFHHLYLSSEQGVKKRTGKLYTAIVEDLKVSPSEIIHIGDTIKSDYIMAKKKGLNAVMIARENSGRTKFCCKRDIEKMEIRGYSELVSFLQNHIDGKWNDYFQFGYETFGPLLYGFSKWMLEDVKKRGIDRVFFFSRDGYIMQKSFHEATGNAVKSNYFYVSRRSLRVPQLWLRSDFEAVIDSFPRVSMLSMRAFMKNLGLDADKYEGIMHKHGLQADEVFLRKDIISNEKLCAFYQEIENDVISNSKYEFDLLMQYMKQEHFEGKIAVVDIGWCGSLQFFLQNIIDKSDVDVQMCGYYIALTSGMRDGIDARGYVKDGVNTKFCDSWSGFSSLVENLSLAQEGSCRTYTNDQGNITPVLYAYEYEKDGVRESEADYVREVQEGALQFIQDAVNAGYEMDVNCRTASANLRNSGNYPTKAVCDLFGCMRFLEEEPVYLAKPDSLLNYLKNPKKFKRDFYYSKWKIGFLKQMLKIPFPYKSFYELAKKISSGE